jgi:hypothetical protein
MRIGFWPATTGTKLMSSVLVGVLGLLRLVLVVLLLVVFLRAGRCCRIGRRGAVLRDHPPVERDLVAGDLRRIDAHGEWHVFLIALRFEHVLAQPGERQVVGCRLAGRSGVVHQLDDVLDFLLLSVVPFLVVFVLREQADRRRQDDRHQKREHATPLFHKALSPKLTQHQRSIIGVASGPSQTVLPPALHPALHVFALCYHRRFSRVRDGHGPHRWS